ncbi:PREDICTED: protein ORAOV1 homolog [Dufourea novaeangliae]|uniref:Oral cancer-overexpressed protein 1 like protein n=1 Tax=Dufourea novaeangliae TaxID=178035 RepID=A0A154PGW4_DUFNO|nr:PREDICTED: protein ORAOV1 homolog [Dufourea novaeangliae]KZC10558.1 hypothetical protein WN55_01995 [Dufourea novaeangliae]
MSDEDDVDINKEFENLLFAEENAQNLGHKEGYEFGKQQLIKGFHLGYHRASLIGAQLGYYCGVLEQYLNANKFNSEKGVTIAKELLQNIYNFPKHNEENVDILGTVDSIKFKYAKFCSLTKTCSSYPEADKFDF